MPVPDAVSFTDEYGAQLASLSFKVGERTVNPDFMRVSGLHSRPNEFKGDEMPAFTSWIKALFDPGSEGIEDTILR